MKKPELAALVAFAGGVALALGGVYVLAGTGWALIAGSIACFALTAVIVRGAK